MQAAPTLVLVGPMGAGKSAIGRRLADRLGLPFADLDEDIEAGTGASIDRKSTRLNSSHVKISYAVFCLKKKKLHILERLQEMSEAQRAHTNYTTAYVTF